MKIGFSFYGISYGDSEKGSKDFRHCWPGLKRDLIDPFVAKGNEAKIYVTTYPFKDPELEREFYELVKPDGVKFCEEEGSDPFTCKGAAFDLFENDDLDFIVFTRLDLHFNKIMVNENIDYKKFNFLFPEVGYWWEVLRFTNDNVYMWPHHMTTKVKEAVRETYRSLRPEQPDTHPLLHKLLIKIGNDNWKLISNTNECSCINTFYTLCRDHGHSQERWHPEVRDRFASK